MAEVYGEDGPPAEEMAQIPLGRLGTPREFGDVVCFLASGARRLHQRHDRHRRRRHVPRAPVKRLFIEHDRRSSPGSCSLALVLGALLVLPSNDYIFLPDQAHPVAPLVTVPGGHDPTKGGIYFVDVIVRKAKLLEQLFGGLHEGADLYPASAVNPPGGDDAQRRQIDLQDMRNSQQVAAAVALRAAGKKVIDDRRSERRSTRSSRRTPAVGKLEPDDVITAIDGTARPKSRDATCSPR